MSSAQPTESELEILQELWQHGPSTVRFVHEQIHQRREVGYTTILKLMQIMAQKGLVVRNTGQRTHIYQAAVTEEQTQGSLLQRFVEKTFRGSATKLVLHALGNRSTTRQELDEIKAFIKKIEEE